MGLPANILKISVGQVIHYLSMFGGIIAVIYTFSGPVIKPYVAQAFSDMLKEQGVDPLVLKKLQDQTTKNSQDLDEVLSTVDTIVDKQNSNEQKLESIEKMVDKLLTIQLKRADFTPSPPGTGPRDVPTLE